MGFIQNMRRRLGRLSAKAAGLTFLPTWARHSFQTYTFSVLVSDGYKGNATANACFRILAWNFPEPELWPWELVDGKEQRIGDHPLRQLLKKPNADMGEAELMQFCIMYAALSGNVYLWKQRNNAGEVIALWPFSDGDIQPVPGINSEEGLVAYYLLDVGDGKSDNPYGVRRVDSSGKGVPIPKSEIIHWKWMVDPEQPWLGIGALEASARDIDTANEMRAFVYSLLKNDAKPPIVIYLAEGDQYDEDRAIRMREQWQSRYGGKNRGLPAFLENTMKVQEMGFNLQQLDMTELQNGPDAAVCMGFGISPMTVGALVGLKNSTYSNLEEANRALAMNTLTPLWRSLSSEFAQAMAEEPGYDNVESIRFDLSQVAALRQNLDALWTRIASAFNNSIITRAEARQAMGYQAGAGDDVYKANLVFSFLPANQTEDELLDISLEAGKSQGRPLLFAPTANGGTSTNGSHPNGRKRWIQTIEAKADDPPQQTGIMVAFMAQSLEALALDEDDLPEGSTVTAVDQLHLTLAYLGDTEEVEYELGDLLRPVDLFSYNHGSVVGKIGGFARFTNTHLDGMDAIVALFDSKRLPEFRQSLVDALRYAGIESPSSHGFIPHITLGYIPADAPTPDIHRLIDIDEDSFIQFTEVTVAWGGEYFDFYLDGRKSDRNVAAWKEPFFAVGQNQRVLLRSYAGSNGYQRPSLTRYSSGKDYTNGRDLSVVMAEAAARKEMEAVASQAIDDAILEHRRREAIKQKAVDLAESVADGDMTAEQAGEILSSYSEHVSGLDLSNFMATAVTDLATFPNPDTDEAVKMIGEALLKEFPDGAGTAVATSVSRAQYQAIRPSINRLRTVRESLVDPMGAELDAYFKAYGERAETALAAFKTGLWTVGREQKAITESEWRQLLDLVHGYEDEEALRRVLGKFTLQVTAGSWELWNGMMGDDIPFSEEDPLVTQLLSTAGQRVRNITESTREQLAEYMQYASENLWTIDDIANGRDDRPGIADFIAETYSGRSRAIARTELGTAQQNAATTRYAESGVKKVVVFDNGFDNSHETCKKLDGTVQSIAWARANPLQHPNCVRAFGPYFEE